MLTLALGAFSSSAWAGDDDHDDGDCMKLDVIGFIPGSSGKAKLCVNDDGVNGNMRVKGLVPGDAYTVWWIYVDDPTQCPDTGCGAEEFLGFDPVANFGRMDSGIAGDDAKLRFRGRIRGMAPSSGSQIWMLMFTHGPANFADRKRLARQLLTPEDPIFGEPQLGNQADGQLGFGAALAIFVIP